jgi:hypothetical protein
MAGFYNSAENSSLVKPFSLYFLDGALEAVTQMHNKGWVHHDLHGNERLEEFVHTVLKKCLTLSLILKMCFKMNKIA